MVFDKTEVDELLADTGRRCCICGSLHNVQVHHIVRTEQGGDDHIDNAIPLCPNCHDRSHDRYAPGRTTRSYTPAELKLHRQRTIEAVDCEKQSASGGHETAGTTGRRVVDKQRIVNAWRERVDELVSQGQLAAERDFILRWHETVEEALERYLRNIARGMEIKREYASLMTNIRRLRNEDRRRELRDKGIQFLKDVKNSVKHQDLR